MPGKGAGLLQSPSAEPQPDHPDLSAGGNREEDPRGEKRKQACGGASFLSPQIPWVASSARHQAWPALTQGPGRWGGRWTWGHFLPGLLRAQDTRRNRKNRKRPSALGAWPSGYRSRTDRERGSSKATCLCPALAKGGLGSGPQGAPFSPWAAGLSIASPSATLLPRPPPGCPPGRSPPAGREGLSASTPQKQQLGLAQGSGLPGTRLKRAQLEFSLYILDSGSQERRSLEPGTAHPVRGKAAGFGRSRCLLGGCQEERGRRGGVCPPGHSRVRSPVHSFTHSFRRARVSAKAR